VRTGEYLSFPAASGPERFLIVGVFYEYSHDQGIVYMSEKNFQRCGGDARPNSLGVYLRDPAAAALVSQTFRARFSTNGQFAIFSNAELRRRVFEIFDQTFAVTLVLRAIAVIVALIGIFFSLTTLVLERSRELAVLRAIGGSRAQVRRLLLSESALIAWLAAAVGIVSGLCLSIVLTGVINRAFFGWTVRLAFPWGTMAATPLWIVAAALAAAVLPAWRAGAMEIAEAVREE
jgi:putative ABC transport system permease protein